MGSINGGSRKPHAVCVPYPTQGHVSPMLQLTKLLHARGFHITFVNTEYNHRRLVRYRGPDAVVGLPDFRFETIPDGLPPLDGDPSQDIPALCDSTRRNCLPPFRDLLAKVNSSPEVPPVTCIISDGVMGFAIKAAKELGIPGFQLWTASACGFMGYLSYRELIRKGIVPFKDENYVNDGTLDRTIDWIPGMPKMQLKDVPTFVRTTDPNDIMLDFMGEEAQSCLNATAIIINTFDELEHQVLEALKSKHWPGAPTPSMYTVGPLSLQARHLPPDSPLNSHRLSLWKEDHHCLQWLDKIREPNSVVYVNYGSITTMTEQHLIEFAWGLANSGHPFLWILRPDVAAGGPAILPEEFLEETKGRGLVASWCAQDKVLCHPAVGVFLSHCGWNSTMESVCGGVPLMCWPFFAEQVTNTLFACREWGMGVEVKQDVKRHEIEALVRGVMEGERGREMRRNAMEWKRKALDATDVGGPSYVNFESFIHEANHGSTTTV